MQAPIWRGEGHRLDWGQPKTAGHRRACKRIEIEALLFAEARAGVTTESLWITLRALAPERFCFCSAGFDDRMPSADVPPPRSVSYTHFTGSVP